MESDGRLCPAHRHLREQPKPQWFGTVAAIERDDRTANLVRVPRCLPGNTGNKVRGVVQAHKSQGSEYPAVVIPVLTQHYAMLKRNLLYTGVTLGKRLVMLVGQKKAVAIAVRNVSGRRRWSKLDEWLAGAKEGPERGLVGAGAPRGSTLTGAIPYR